MSKAKFSAQAEKLKNLVDSARLQTSSSAVTATAPSQPNEGAEEVSGRPVAARTKAKNLKAIPLSYFEAHAELKKEIAAATSEEADMLSRLEMAERTVEENRKPHPAGKVEEVPEEEEEPVTIGSLAMPSYSAAQLASRVKKAGDAPDIVKDDITKVTLFDYSDIISGDVDDMEE